MKIYFFLFIFALPNSASFQPQKISLNKIQNKFYHTFKKKNSQLDLKSARSDTIFSNEDQINNISQYSNIITNLTGFKFSIPNSRVRLISTFFLVRILSWILFSSGSTFPFALMYTSMFALSEYSSVVELTGVNSNSIPLVISSLISHVLAQNYPNYHEMSILLSVNILLALSYCFRSEPATLHELACSLFGMIYLGYFPSFWLRLRNLNGIINFKPKFILPFNSPIITENLQGPFFVILSWIVISLSDIGGFVIGKPFGNTKISSICPIAGIVSPNKSVQGLLGGIFLSIVLGVGGAWWMGWPGWAVSGTIFGVLLASVGLLGDLTASSLKRDVGIKDFSQLIPGHGGILDRFDSILFAAPFAFYFVKLFLPHFENTAH